MKTGIFGLDELLGSGFIRKSVNIILGSTGTGKTIFALQFLLKGLKTGEKGIFISFDMDENKIIDIAESIGWEEIKDFTKDGLLTVRKFYAEDISYITHDLLTFINSEARGETRLAIDSFTPLIVSLGYEVRNDINWFFSKLRDVCTTVITLEEPLNGDLSLPFVSIPLFLGDTVIHLRNIGYGEAFNRTIRIIKHRGSWHAEGVFPYRILDGFGIFIEGYEYVLQQYERVDLEEILENAGVEKEKLDNATFKRLKRLAESRMSDKKTVLLEILKHLKKDSV